ncbi:MAG TPA: xanthine dehydrogenase molybdopterin binding subunit [Burkholderiaceae bacterium]|nr:xanthine dehydrogenase molybdopterin binding subunit [Burkholderiaceae bacterium]
MNKPAEPLIAEALPQIGRDRAHESAHLHVAGEATYTDDIRELDGTLHCALGLSPVAHGRLVAVDLDRLRAEPGVTAVFAAGDVPGVNDCGPIVHGDDPILAFDEVHYLGQPVFAVCAADRRVARRVCARAKEFVTIEPLPALLTARAAHAARAYVVPPMHLARGDAAAALASAPHRFKDSLSVNGQEQFYLEGQISYAIPLEDDGLLVHCSTQHPTEMQHAVARALGLRAHQVQVQCRRMGGGFGGKESQSALFACVAALAAKKLNRPVKLRLDRDDDFMATGRRHGFDFDFEVGFDAEGRLLGVEIDLIANAGFSADLSPPVMTRAICHFDNAYWLPAVSMHGYCARTNTQSNTAFRGFGGPQGAIAIEFILDSVARRLGKDPLDVRRVNYYGVASNNVTPYGQTVDDNLLEPLTAQLVKTSRYRERRAEIAAFNAASPVLKRGIAFTPVKFGISFNVNHFNQAGALVHVYTDGSVLVNHGGTEMGQGVNTKVAMVVAHELRIPLASVRCTATDTHKVANTSATAASTGADLNGKAAQDAARKIRARLDTFAAASGLGAAPFVELVQAAYVARVQLWSDGFYATPGLSWDRATMTGKPFFYFAYGAAVSEVIVDTLTGEHRLLAADLLHDVGTSLNPAIDIGQVEGAYIQGYGWLAMEELVWHPDTGALLTHAPSTYKIPTANDAPARFHTALFETPNPAETIHRSKAVGEPPLLLPFSALLAIRDAISAVGGHRIDPPLRAPATPQAVLDAVGQVRAAR